MIGADLSDFSDFVDSPDNSDRPHFTKELLKKKLGKTAHIASTEKRKSPSKDQAKTSQEDKQSAGVSVTTPLKLEIPPQSNDISSRNGQPTTPSPSQGGGADETYSCVSNSSRESGISSAFSSELDTPSKKEHLATIVDTETNSNPGSGVSATASPSLLRAAVKANFTPTPAKSSGDENLQPNLTPTPSSKVTNDDANGGDAGGSHDGDDSYDTHRDSANHAGYANRYNGDRRRFGLRRDNVYNGGRKVPRSLPLRMGNRPNMMPFGRDRIPYDESDFPPMDSTSDGFYQTFDHDTLQQSFYNGYVDGSCDFSAHTNGHHEVFVHVNPGETLSVRVGNDIQHIPGPATVRMVSHNPGPPAPLPLHVPPGHVVQQIVDETGALKHLILSPQHPHIPGTIVQPNARGGYGYPSPEAFLHGELPFAMGRQGPMLSSPPMFDPTSSQHSRTPSEASASLGRVNGSTSANHRRNLSSEESDSHEDSKRKLTPSGGRSSKLIKGNTRGNDNSCMTAEDDNASDVELTESRNVENEEQSKLIELLSKIAPPSVTEIGSRDALIQWQRIDCSEASCGPFPEIEASDFSYEVFLAEQSAEGKYKQMFRGCATEYRLSELKPATEYYIKLRAVIEPWRGNQSEAIQFRTAPCRPDKPPPLKFWNRTKTSITLKWNAAVDNGSRLVSYHLETVQSNPNEKITDTQFTEVYSGLEKQYRLTKLNPGSTYKFRLAAANDLGKSDYSDVLTVSTSGNAPAAPDPPQLTEADTFSLHLAWQKRPGDEEFVLQMDDSATSYGFIPVCNGRELTWICSELRHSQNYHFRLRAINEDGESPWSEVVTYRTKPDKPSPPGKPYPKGRIHTTSVKLAWDPPSDNGGSEITSFSVEYMTPSVSENWALLLCGQEREHNVTGLCPGRTYNFRVSCRSDGGQSAYSEILAVTTLPVAPGPCQAPVLTSKPKSNSVHLKWAAPDQAGGAEISQYEISMAQPDGTVQHLSSGERLDCAVAGLLPGRVYTFRIRAHNKAGAGSWSEPLECYTAAGPPDPPKHVKCVTKSSNSVVITWAESQNNGAPITEIRIQQAHRRSPVRKPSLANEIECESATVQTQQASCVDDSQGSVSSAASSANSSPVHRPRRSSSNQEGTKSAESITSDVDVAFYEYTQIFAGPLASCQYEVKSLKPATEYAFRLQAVNSAGISKFSSVGVCVTPPGPPSSVASFQAEAISTSSIIASWEEADSNGSPVTSYKLEIYELPEGILVGSLDVESDVFSHSFNDLKCDTTYRIRVLAQNVVGDGPWTSGLRVSTFSPPPNPPILECVSAGYNSLKLRWADSTTTQEALAYSLEMENKNGSFSPTYEGPGHLHKVSRLNECWTYRFRIRATSPTGGIGVWSETYSFATTRTPPPAIKAPPKVFPAGDSSWQVEIQPVKVALPSNEKLYYVVQFNSSRQSPDDFKTVYSGPSNTYTLSGLEGNATYRVRVCLARLSPCGEGTTETLGPLSGVTSFTLSPQTSPSAPLISAPGLEESDSKISFVSLMRYVYSALRGDIEMSESHYAIFFVVVFCVFALAVAFVVQWAMDSR